MSKCWIYVLESIKDGWVYVGHTIDIQRRLEQHNSGKMKSTGVHAPFRLAYIEEHKTCSEAMKREKFLESGFGRLIRRLLIAKGKCSMRAI